MRILVVEDQQPNIMVITLMLDELGHPHDVARSSAEALEKIDDGNYGLVLMDVRMAGRDGIETTRTSAPWKSSTRVIRCR